MKLQFERDYVTRGYSQKTAESYARWLIDILKYTSKDRISEIEFEDVVDYVHNYLTKRRNLKTQSIGNAISALRVYFQQILSREFDTSKLHRPKRISNSSDAFEKQEILFVLSNASNLKHKLLISLMYSCALDIHAVQNIRLEDVDLKNKSLTIRTPKDKVFRQTPLSDFEVSIIDEYKTLLNPKKFLFEGRDGARYSERSIANAIKKAVAAAGIQKNISTRSLRYSYIKHLHEFGFPLKNISSHLKVADLRTVADLLFDPTKKVLVNPLSLIKDFEFNSRIKQIEVNQESILSSTPFIYDTPYITTNDVEAAIKMSKLYVIIHCYENSTRNFLRKIFSERYGEIWWEKVAPSDMKNRVLQKINKEKNSKWLSPRANGLDPLYYIDWSDLLRLMRKNEELLLPYLNDIKFVELRLEELERTRHIIAHNGVLPSEDDFMRIQLYYKDWIRQLK